VGIFDKVVKDAEEAMARDDPGLAQQAGQAGGDQASGQAGQGMQAAQNLIGKQRGAQDQDQDLGGDQDGGDQDYSDEDW
jgi:hypothetical protein